MYEKKMEIYHRHFSDIDDSLTDYVADHVSKTIGETAVDELWSNKSNLDKFHDIRNRIVELVTNIEWEKIE
tara:strand:+ start:998 stop:1210 length:213 start_codon:yes stop_codon:yes gene_type:complete